MATTPVNALNISSSGLVKFDGTATFSGVTVTQHDVLIGGASNGITSVAPSSTSGVPLISQGASADPVFGTAVVAGGGTGSVSFNTNGVVVSGSTTTTALAALSLTDGQVVIGSSAGAPLAATLTAGTGISISNGHNTITINGLGGGLTWSDTSGTVTASVNTGYYITTTCTSTLPASPSQGDLVAYKVDTTNVLTITANTGQVIRVGSQVSVSAGTCASNARGDAIFLTYRTADTAWIAAGVEGTWSLQTS